MLLCETAPADFCWHYKPLNISELALFLTHFTDAGKTLSIQCGPDHITFFDL